MVVHRDGTREPLAIGVPGDRAIDEKRLGALVAFGVPAWLAASRLRGSLSMSPTGGRQRCSRAAAVAAIVLALLAPLVLLALLVLWAAAEAMSALAYSDTTFDVSVLVLQAVGLTIWTLPPLSVPWSALCCGIGPMPNTDDSRPFRFLQCWSAPRRCLCTCGTP